MYFSFEYDPAHNNVHPIHRDWTPEMVEAFKFNRKDTTTGKDKVFLPIIPNLYELKDKLEKVNRNPYKRTVEDWPIYNPEQLFAIAPKLEERIKKMIDLTLTKFSDSTPDVKHPVTEKWIEKYYHQGFFKKITGWVGGKLFNAIIATSKGTVA